MSHPLESLLKKEGMFLSVDASVLYDDRTNSYVCIKLEDLDSEQTLRLNGNSEQAVYDRLKQEGLVMSYTPEQQHLIKQDTKWLLEETFQEEVAENVEIGWDDLSNAYLYEHDGRLELRLPGVGLGVEQIAGSMTQSWGLFNTTGIDLADRYYHVDRKKEFTYLPKEAVQEISQVSTNRFTPENTRGEPVSSNEQLKQKAQLALVNLTNFDDSYDRYVELSEVYNSDENPTNISVDRKGEWLENGRFRVEERYDIEFFSGGEVGEKTVLEIGLKSGQLSFAVTSNLLYPSIDDSPLRPLENVQERVVYQFEMDRLTTEQLQTLVDFTQSPITEIDQLLTMIDAHESIFEQTKAHDMNQWLTQYNGFTPQEQHYVTKQIDYQNHLSLGATFIDSSPKFAVAKEELDNVLGELVGELERLYETSEDLYALDTELSMMPDTIKTDVHELLATDQYKQRAAAFKVIEETLSPEQAFSRRYGIEHDRAFSSEDLLNLYERSGDLSTNDVYAAINRHQSETIVEWSYSGGRTKVEIDEYQKTKMENLSEKVTSGHATYQINADTELLIVPSKEGRGHDGFLLSPSGEVTSLKTASREETVDKLIDLDAYAVPSLPSLKSLLASPDPQVSQENTRQHHQSKMIDLTDIGRDYR